MYNENEKAFSCRCYGRCYVFIGHAGESVSINQPINFTSFSGLNTQLGVSNASSFKMVKEVNLKKRGIYKVKINKTFGDAGLGTLPKHNLKVFKVARLSPFKVAT